MTDESKPKFKIGDKAWAVLIEDGHHLISQGVITTLDIQELFADWPATWPGVPRNPDTILMQGTYYGNLPHMKRLFKTKEEALGAFNAAWIKGNEDD